MFLAMRFAILPMLITHHCQAHRAGGTGNLASGGIDLARVHALDLLFGDFAALGHGDLADWSTLARLLGTGIDLRRLLEEVGRRWRLHFEGERFVLIGGDHHRHRGPGLHALRSRIEGLAEFHDIEAALTKCWTDRR